MKWFIRTLSLIIGLSIGLYVFGPGLILWEESTRFAEEVKSLTRLANQRVYFSQCEALALDNEHPVTGVQLRFETNTDYVIEGICVGGPNHTFTHKRGKLKFGVEKSQGQSGIKLNFSEDSWYAPDQTIALEFFKTYRFVSLLEKKVTNARTLSAPITNTSGQTPATACAGWGNQCCLGDLVGEGSAQPFGVLDCQGACFNSCTHRPIVTVFSAEPYPDQNRIVNVRVSQPVNFSWVVQEYDEETVNISLNYGDGIVDQFPTRKGSSQHTYSCPTNTCRYIATLTSTDASNHTNEVSRKTNLTIIVAAN